MSTKWPALPKVLAEIEHGIARLDEMARQTGLQRSGFWTLHFDRAGLSKLHAALTTQTVPEPVEKLHANLTDPGYVRVPVEPTTAMRYAVEETRLSEAWSRQSTQHEIGVQVYTAMIEAATKETNQ